MVGLLCRQLVGEMRVAEPAERVVRGARRNRVGLAALAPHLLERTLPGFLHRRRIARPLQHRLGAHEAGEQDVADLVVNGVVPVRPFLLHEAAAQPEHGGDGGHLTGVVRLDVADRDQRVAALRQRVGREPLQLAHLVAAEGEARGDVVALCPDLDAEFLGEPMQRVDRRGPETELAAREPAGKIEGHAPLRCVRWATLVAHERARVRVPAAPVSVLLNRRRQFANPLRRAHEQVRREVPVADDRLEDAQPVVNVQRHARPGTEAAGCRRG